MNDYIITVFCDVHTRDYYHKICICDMRYYIAGKEGVRSVPNVRYYHKLFSDQDIPNW